MEIISFERSTYEELQTNFNRFFEEMKRMGSRGTDKRLGEWLDNQDVYPQSQQKDTTGVSQQRGVAVYPAGW